MSTFQDAMTQLALAVAQKAKKEDTPLAEATDALKALTPYLALVLKNKGKVTDQDAESSFADFQKEINGADDGTSAVRSRSRRRADA